MAIERGRRRWFNNISEKPSELYADSVISESQPSSAMPYDDFGFEAV